MKLVVFLGLIVVAASKQTWLNSDLNEHWENFKKAFGKIYDDTEEISRRSIFEQKLAYISQHNLKYDLGLRSFRMGINEFSDMEHEEFVGKFRGLIPQSNQDTNSSVWVPVGKLHLPRNVDWRKKGLVTPVKNQLSCNSCWTFAATGSLEGQHKKQTGKLVSLSEQNLVDCSGNKNCNPYYVSEAFEYIKKNHGIDTEESYPYTGVPGNCHFKKSSVGATLKGYNRLPRGDEEALKEAVATIGPIAVAVHASEKSFVNYQDGIYDEPGCGTINHAVLAIGYGTEDGKDYWLVKNSWGTSWGNKGYIKMSRNKNNQCGIATQTMYPVV